MYLNKAIVFGNLTRDPELKALPSGIQVASFSLATNRVYKDKEGNKKEQAEFHNIVLFGKQAELAAKYLKKGGSVLIEGRMQTRSWEADGQKKYRTEIIAEGLQFGPRTTGGGAGGSSGYGGGASAGADEGGSGASSSAKSKPAASAKGAAKAPAMDTIDYPEEEINPEDIPF